MYTMYMDKEEYSIAEFRANLRVALDRADDGNDVYIKRHGKRYFVCPEDYYQELLNEDTFIGLKPPPIGKKPKAPPASIIAGLTEIPVSASRFDKGVCKIHGLPLDSRGRCLQKNCKYA